MLCQRCKDTNNSVQLRAQPKHNKDGVDQMSSRQVQATAIAGESRAYHFKADAGSYVWYMQAKNLGMEAATTSLKGTGSSRSSSHVHHSQKRTAKVPKKDPTKISNVPVPDW